MNSWSLLGGLKTLEHFKQIEIALKEAGTKVGLGQLGSPVRVGPTRIDSDHKKIKNNKEMRILTV